MKGNKLTVLVILSLAFNVAVLAVFGFFLLHRDVDEQESTLHEYRFCPGPRKCRHFAGRFGLNSGRADSFVTEMNKFSGEEKKIENRITEKRFELMELLHESQPGEKALMKMVDEISGLQSELEKILVRRLLHVNSLLSEAERAKFHKMLLHRMGMRRGPETFLPPYPETSKEGEKE
jgi:hypothetical protein